MGRCQVPHCTIVICHHFEVSPSRRLIFSLIAADADEAGNASDELRWRGGRARASHRFALHVRSSQGYLPWKTRWIFLAAEGPMPSTDWRSSVVAVATPKGEPKVSSSRRAFEGPISGMAWRR